MINDMITITLVFAAGLLTGIIFFGGLWFTVQKIVHSKKGSLWVFGSFILRVSVALLGFYLAGAGDFKRLLVCVAGFIAARFIVLHFTKVPMVKNLSINKEVPHET